MELNKLKGIKRTLVILAMVELIAGMFMIVFNANGKLMLIRLMGIIAAAYGFITLVLYLFKKDKKENVSMLITSVLGLVAGACFIFLYKYMDNVFDLIVGIFAGVFGVMKIPNMFIMKKAGFRKWYIMLIPILLIITLGVIVGLNAYNDSVFTDSVEAILLGIAFMLGCAADIIALTGTADVDTSIVEAEAVEAEQSVAAINDKNNIVEKK